MLPLLLASVLVVSPSDSRPSPGGLMVEAGRERCFGLALMTDAADAEASIAVAGPIVRELRAKKPATVTFLAKGTREPVRARVVRLGANLEVALLAAPRPKTQPLTEWDLVHPPISDLGFQREWQAGVWTDAPSGPEVTFATAKLHALDGDYRELAIDEMTPAPKVSGPFLYNPKALALRREAWGFVVVPGRASGAASILNGHHVAQALFDPAVTITARREPAAGGACKVVADVSVDDPRHFLTRLQMRLDKPGITVATSAPEPVGLPERAGELDLARLAEGRGKLEFTRPACGAGDVFVQFAVGSEVPRHRRATRPIALGAQPKTARATVTPGDWPHDAVALREPSDQRANWGPNPACLPVTRSLDPAAIYVVDTAPLLQSCNHLRLTRLDKAERTCATFFADARTLWMGGDGALNYLDGRRPRTFVPDDELVGPACVSRTQSPAANDPQQADEVPSHPRDAVLWDGRPLYLDVPELAKLRPEGGVRSGPDGRWLVRRGLALFVRDGSGKELEVKPALDLECGFVTAASANGFVVAGRGASSPRWRLYAVGFDGKATARGDYPDLAKVLPNPWATDNVALMPDGALYTVVFGGPHSAVWRSRPRAKEPEKVVDEAGGVVSLVPPPGSEETFPPRDLWNRPGCRP